MKIIKSSKYGKIVPAKLIGNQYIKIKDIPFLESKKVNNNLDTSIPLSTGSSNMPISNMDIKKNIEKISEQLSKKYELLMEDVKNDKEMIGTVEENIGEYPNHNPFSPSKNLNTKSNISKAKKVLFKKKDKNELILKVINSNLFLSIYNKPPPQKKIYKISEISKITKVQNKFKGIYKREVEKVVDRLKIHDCILETIALMVGKAYDNAIKRKTLKIFRKEFLDPFNRIDDEILFEDKIQFKLPNRYYNIDKIRENTSPKKSTKKKFILNKSNV